MSVCGDDVLLWILERKKEGRESSRVKLTRCYLGLACLFIDSVKGGTLFHQMGGNETHSYESSRGCGGGEEELITCAADSCGFMPSGCPYVCLQCLLSNALNSTIPYGNKHKAIYLYTHYTFFFHFSQLHAIRQSNHPTKASGRNHCKDKIFTQNHLLNPIKALFRNRPSILTNTNSIAKQVIL